jgi:hypothetical protein
MHYNNKIQRMLEVKLLRYLEYLSVLQCHCKSSMLELDQHFIPNRHVLREQKFGFIGSKAHTRGRFWKVLVGTHVTKNKIEQYADDLEHGLLHGFCVGFFTLLYKFGHVIVPNNVFRKESSREDADDTYKLIASCLLHDFYRCTNSNENHDNKLYSYFPNLSSVVFNHCEPVDITHPLIVGDRQELFRYNDRSWIRLDELMLYKDRHREIDYFYRFIRPALELIYKYRKDIWIKHGTENGFADYKYESDQVYPKGYWQADPNQDGFYSIDTGKFLKGCLRHYVGIYPHGIIPLSIVREHEGTIKQAYMCDHCAMNHQIPINRWLFDSNNFIQMIRERKPTEEEDVYNMIELSAGVIDFTLARRFVMVLDRFIDILILLNTIGNKDE